MSIRVTFGIIVLNGEPFTRYCLRSLYPFAHEIIVVEGASKKAAAIATSDGHSTDGTLEALHQFKAEEDPDDKVQIVTRTGFWNEKDEQSRAYAERATGDYLWQVDIDEFYTSADMRRVIKLLESDPSISGMSFKTRTFWGGFDYVTDGGYLRNGAEIYRRLFKWGPGYEYVTHRPPTVRDERGRNLCSLKWLDGRLLARKGIATLFHYSLVFPAQVRDKVSYYSQLKPFNYDPLDWYANCYATINRPFRFHNVYMYRSWLERFRGVHPEAIQQLQADIKAGRIAVECRNTDDIERLLRSPRYLLARTVLQLAVSLRTSKVGEHIPNRVYSLGEWIMRILS